LSALQSTFKGMNDCPTCKSPKGIREVIYGLPEGPVDEAKYSLGGCCISENDAMLICIDCGWEGNFVNNIERLT
jgi:hypothetical protein